MDRIICDVIVDVTILTSLSCCDRHYWSVNPNPLLLKNSGYTTAVINEMLSSKILSERKN